MAVTDKKDKKPYKSRETYQQKKKREEEEKKAAAPLSKEEKREVRQKRKLGREYGDVSAKILNIYKPSELTSKTKQTRERYEKYITMVLELPPAQLLTMAKRMDTTRVVQLVIKYTTPAERDILLDKLTGNFSDMMKDKYGHHVMLKFVQFSSTAQKTLIIDELGGNIRKLAFDPHSAQVLDQLYMTSNKPQQWRLLREIANMKSYDSLKFATEEAKSNEYTPKTDLETKLHKLSDVEAQKMPEHFFQWITVNNPLRASAILHTMEILISNIILKEMLMFRFNHSIVLQYLELASIRNANKRDIISDLNKYILALHDNREGVLVACHAIAYGTVKDRKNAIKAVKGRVVELCLHEHAYMIIMKLLAFIDDTVLLKKQIISEILTPSIHGEVPFVLQLLASPYGCKVLHLIVSPHNRTFFTQKELAQLQYVTVPASILAKKEVKEPKEETKEGDEEDAKPVRKDFKLIEIGAVDENEDFVATSKKVLSDKVRDFANVVVAVFEALLLGHNAATGYKGKGFKRNSNLSDKKAKKDDEEMKDGSDDDDEDKEEDNEEEEEEDAEIMEDTSALFADKYCVLSGYIKSLAPSKVIASALSFVFANKNNNAFKTAVPQAQNILAGLVELVETGNIDVDIQSVDKVAANVIPFLDPLHVFVNGYSHLLYKRVTHPTSFPTEVRDEFVKNIWNAITGKKNLLDELVLHNRPCFSLAHIVAESSFLSQAEKTISKLKSSKTVSLGKDLLSKVLKGGSLDKETEVAIAAVVPAVGGRQVGTKSKREEIQIDEDEIAKVINTVTKTPKKAKTAAKEETPIPEKKSRGKKIVVAELNLDNIAEESDAPAEPATPNSLRRSARLSAPSTPLSQSESGVVTPRRAGRVTKAEIPTFALEGIDEEEEEEEKPKKVVKAPTSARKSKK